MSNDPAATEPAPPQPTAAHKRLEEHAGRWKVAAKFYMDPSQPPMEIEATETIEMFGGFWTVSTFEADMFGAPFRGKATLGYDPIAEEYVSTWIDTMSPNFFKFTGNFDASGKVLEMSGEAYSMMTNELTRYRTTEEHKGPDERVLEMFVTAPDGSELKMFTHVYTRA